jgi:TonB family protein
MPAYWLPEVVVGNIPLHDQSPVTIWAILCLVYGAVVIILLARLMLQLIGLLRYIDKANVHRVQKNYVLELPEGKPTFSFFKYIFLGASNQLAEKEKEQIIRHESVHAERFHSLDILFIHCMSIFFWFNPILRFYKKTLVQLHEFEADARSVTNQDVDQYCGLLAKVALHSAEFPIANHFNNSLTLKRIAMMKTIKQNIPPLKKGLLLSLAALFFIVIACQDQVMHDLQEVAKTSTVTTDYPAEVQEAMAKIKEVNTLAEIVVVGVMEGDNSPLENLDKQVKINEIRSVNVIKPKQKTGDYDAYVGIEKGGQFAQIAEETATDDEVFTVVEEMAQPEGGLPVFYEFLAENLRYPETARKAGIQGKTFIEFIINKDGTLSDFKVLKSLSPECDAEAIRAISLSVPWTPGKQRGIIVKQRLVLPVTFALDDVEKEEGS